jgi:hypothetical protein
MSEFEFVLFELLFVLSLLFVLLVLVSDMGALDVTLLEFLFAKAKASTSAIRTAAPIAQYVPLLTRLPIVWVLVPSIVVVAICFSFPLGVMTTLSLQTRVPF